MSLRFVIEIDWERLDSGPPEERATFGAIGLRAGDVWLSEAHDRFVNSVRQKVHLSGYLLAHWLAWNWWRLRWEPRRRSLAWKMAHRLPTIGGGYVWPNVDFDGDGERVLLKATPTRACASEPLRYVTEAGVVVSAPESEYGIEQFIDCILGKLRSEDVRQTHLESTWAHVVNERKDAEFARYRRIEAAMGYDPGEAAESAVQSLVSETKVLGEDGVAELAAGSVTGVPAPGSKELREIADRSGYDVDLGSIPREPIGNQAGQDVGKPSWLGAHHAARDFRNRCGLGGGVLTNQRLAELAGVSSAVLPGDATSAPFSFALDGGSETARLVLQSPIVTSRRFALARLIGDRILAKVQEPLVPIMRSYTYRQKRQRAFAAELLCPFEHASQLFDSDFSVDSQEQVAAEYQVSPMLVRTQLVNNGFLPRETLDDF
ncbi:MAG: hypothetical protein JXR96_25550 [Deltaproteobacteria bacterium]|nr:hypothetical protein [Deltaproteobacteria bacterium]